ncbi:MAG: DUF4105 domain-containing protein [Gemmatimonadota bacterium]
MVRRLVAAFALFVSATASVRAQTPPAPATASEMTVTLVTFGLGDLVWERFGHNGLWFHDPATGEDALYDWGRFNFKDPDFLIRFLKLDTKYYMGASDGPGLIEAYRERGRPITLQRLNLSRAQAQKLYEFVRWNALEANKYYRYDYFVDNCSTRLRDALDNALGGAIKRASATALTRTSYRRESVRLTDGDRPVQLGINLALGRPADAPLTEWESYFIPMRLRDGVRKVQVPGPDGTMVPLVAQERELALPPGMTAITELPEAPRLAWRYLVLGLLLAAVVVVLRLVMMSHRAAAWALAVIGAVWSLINGVLGVILLVVWLATLHVFWKGNENVLILTPMSLPLVILIPAALLRNQAERAARMVASIIVAMSAVALVLAIAPGGQENRAIVALVVPVHLALAWALALPKVVRPT